MEQRRAPEGRAQESPQLAAVEQWPALRGEPKLAWRHIWEFAGRRVDTTAVVNASWIGWRQGTSDRGGDRALKALAAEGLIELVERAKGRWTIYLPDPLDVARARRSRGCDGQGELFPEEPLAEEPTSPPTGLALREPAADVAQHPPRRAAPDLDFAARASKDLDLDFSSDFQRSAQANAAARGRRSPRETAGGSGATSAGGANATRIGAMLGSLGAEAGFERRTDSLEAYVRWLKQRVGEIGDEGKFESFAAKVARLVFGADNRFDDDTVADVLLSLDRKRRSGELRCAYAFFVRCIQRKLADQRLSFPP